MPAVVHRYDPPERFVAGTVGQPGERTFFLQAREGARVTSVALEKEQVAVLAERLDAMLDEVLRRSGGNAPVPAVTPAGFEDEEPLEQPIVEEFRVGTMTLAWDADTQQVVLELFPVAAVEAAAVEEATTDPSLGLAVEEPAEPAEEPEADEVLLVRITAAHARAFTKRALAVVAAGRPPCPFCGSPLDPSGHLCPRANGFRRTPD